MVVACHGMTAALLATAHHSPGTLPSPPPAGLNHTKRQCSAILISMYCVQYSYNKYMGVKLAFIQYNINQIVFAHTIIMSLIDY